MNGLKTFGRASSSLIFKVTIVLFAVFLPIILVFGNSNTLKTTLEQSGIYSSAVDTALDSATKNATQENGLPFEQPEVKAAINQAVPPKQIQAWSEQVIDGTYIWLNSDATNPAITLDFASTKQNLAAALGDYAVNRAKTLPTCTNAQLRALQASGGTVDAFKGACIPQGFDVASLRSNVEREVLGNSDFLGEASFTTADLPKNEQGKTPFEQAAIARTIYMWAKITPYIWAGIAILAAGLVILLHDKRRRGVYVVMRTLSAVGIFVSLTALLVRYLVTQVSSPTGVLVKQVQGDFQPTMIFIVRHLGNSMNNVYIVIGVAYLALGGIGLLVLKFTQPKQAETTKPDDLHPTDEAPREQVENTDTDNEAKLSETEAVPDKDAVDNT